MSSTRPRPPPAPPSDGDGAPRAAASGFTLFDPDPGPADVAAWVRQDAVRLERVGMRASRVPRGAGTAARGAAGPLELVDLVWQPPFEARERYHVDELLTYHDAEFVANAYRALLGRAPDPTGSAHFTESLRSGRLSKVEILARLRWSPEGRRRGVVVRGLLPRAAVRVAGRVPVLGHLVRWVVGLLTLPGHVRREETFEAYALAQHAMAARHANEMLRRVNMRLEELARRVSTTPSVDTETTLREMGELRRSSREAEERLGARVDALEAAGDETRGILAVAQPRLSAVQAELTAVLQGVAALQGLARAAEEERRAALAHLERVDRDLRDGDGRLVRVENSSRDHAGRLERVEADRRIAAEWAADVTTRLTRLRAELDDLRGHWLALDGELDAARAAGAPRASSAAGATGGAPIVAAASRPAHGLDSLYVALEDVFRGSRSEIRERLSVWLPEVRAAGAGTTEAPVVDLGCGRGEWLELLGEAGLRGYGVDANPRMTAECRQRGLDARDADALVHLRGLPPASVGAVTAFHLIEHLPFEVVVALLDAARAALRSGGLLIVETPDPRNVTVATHTFHLDPTHHVPVPPELLRFVAEARGWRDVEVRGLHAPESLRVAEDTETARRLNDAFYGPFDYALVARAPAA